MKNTRWTPCFDEARAYYAVEVAEGLGALDLDAAPQPLSMLQIDLEPVHPLHIGLPTFILMS